MAKKKKEKPTKQRKEKNKNEVCYDRKGRRKYTLKEKIKNVFSLYDELIFCKSGWVYRR